MKAADFHRIALSLEGAVEGSHMGAPDFRVGVRIFATLASEDQGCGNLMLTPEQQAEFVRELPEVFLPIHGGWGRMGMTHLTKEADIDAVVPRFWRQVKRAAIDRCPRVERRQSHSIRRQHWSRA